MNFKSFIGKDVRNEYSFLVMLQFSFGEQLFVVENDHDEEVTEVFFWQRDLYDDIMVETKMKELRTLFNEMSIIFYQDDNVLELKDVPDKVTPFLYTELDKLDYAMEYDDVINLLDKYTVELDGELVEHKVEVTIETGELVYNDEDLTDKQREARDSNKEFLEKEKIQPNRDTEFTFAYDMIKKRQAKFLIFSGGPGTGKTTSVRQIAALLDAPFFIKPINGDTDTVEFIGGGTILENDTGEGINVGFVSSDLVYAAEHGGIVAIEEANMAKPEITAILNNATDDNRVLKLNTGRTVHFHENTIIIFTQNPGLAGTNRQNLSLIDRSDYVVDFGELELNDVITRLTAFSGYDNPKFYTKLLDVTQKVSAWVENEFAMPPAVIGFRNMKAFTKLVLAAGGSQAVRVAFNGTYINKLFLNRMDKELKQEIMDYVSSDLSDLELILDGIKRDTLEEENDVDTDDVDEVLYEDEA